MASGSYRPQSPDLSSLHTSGYRPQSPDLTTPIYSIQRPVPGYSNHFDVPQANHQQPTSAPLPPQQYSQPYTPHHIMPARTKQEDTYMPDAPGKSEMQQAIKTESDPTLGVVLKTSFPVARIKRIMQADEDIGKVAQVTPHVVSRALELFMIKLITASSEQARGHAGANSKAPRRVLAQHMKKAIQADETFDFLADIIAKVPDAPVKAKKEANSDSEDSKPKKRVRKQKDASDGA
ncbi:hypothetical protein AMS68_006041 [Peltaster fructicola]|uniref:Transcription factor CBF/NF-Y/archaeal histone domain-containing protein n=1 Tax=Peltaster fructicola TaxID=286661 RepID=A0A6H0Y0J1_9PEZI|nr:hypothetical protein AMS68_006041 [Peltaster fructicola]